MFHFLDFQDYVIVFFDVILCYELDKVTNELQNLMKYA